MGRPLSKRFFGNTNAGGIAGEGVASVTVSGTNNAYITLPAPSFAAPTLPGGVTATGFANMGVATVAVNNAGTGYTDGDVLTLVGGTFTVAATFTVAETGGIIDSLTLTNPGNYTVLPSITGATVTGGTGASATVNLTFKVNTVTVTEAGSGYASAPAISVTGNATLTAVMTTSGVNGITAYAYTGGSSKVADIVKQTGSKRYRVTTADGTVDAYLKASAATSASEMTIVGTDEASGTYFITKLTSHSALVTRGTGTVHATGARVGWSFDAAVDADGIIKIQNA